MERGASLSLGWQQLDLAAAGIAVTSVGCASLLRTRGNRELGEPSLLELVAEWPLQRQTPCRFGRNHCRRACVPGSGCFLA